MSLQTRCNCRGRVYKQEAGWTQIAVVSLKEAEVLMDPD